MTIDATATTTIHIEPPRDRWGRYLVPRDDGDDSASLLCTVWHASPMLAGSRDDLTLGPGETVEDVPTQEGGPHGE